MKKPLFFIVLLASTLIIRNLVFSIYNLWNKQNLLSQIERELQREKEKNKELQEQFARVSSADFLEEEARNKLFLIKPGENEVIISSKLLHASRTVTPMPVERVPNWKKWLDLFL